MKKSLLILTLTTTLCLPACRRSPSNDIVKVDYLHKYGVPVSESDWHKQGRDGQIVEMTRDGVQATKSYAEGVLHGLTTYTYPNSSTIQRKESYEEGRLVSCCTMYPSGIPHYEESFVGNERVALTSWYEQGTPQKIEKYSNGLLTEGEYRNLSNEVESRVKGGEGIRLERSNEGLLVAKEKISQGALSERIVFYANGEPKEVIPFKNGEIDGTRLTFFLGAIPHTVEEWKNGVQEGITCLYQNGEKLASIPYMKGKKEGIELLYRNGNEIVEEITWKANKMHGKRTLYIEEGATKVEWYLEGELVNKMTYDRLNAI